MTTAITIADHAAARDSEVRRLIGGLRVTFLRLGIELALISAHRLYVELGHSTFSGYLDALVNDADHPVDIGLSQLWLCIRVARVYVPAVYTTTIPAAGAWALPDGLVPLELVERIGVTRAYALAPLMADPEATDEQRREWLAQAETAPSAVELRRIVRAQGRPGHDGVFAAWTAATAGRWHRLAGHLEQAENAREAGQVVAEMARSVAHARIPGGA